ncbi:phosphoribosyltransferase family protein [Fodinicurvata sp. CAU 1616]|uniref:Phosphoribosyltransferase family protein n=1 Tax=Aquibaculum arenosum TaxID=3032591 RepID=A0ABT5YN16_9PROT|nr:phosphoribosyltransferase family protein [Fodinicurvata sp. CAU 1616]
MPFQDRGDAGRQLAAVLAAQAPDDPMVLALPRGGVAVALEIALALKAPLDLLLVRKIGVPWQPELAAGALVDADPPAVVMNEDVVAATGMSQDDIDAAVERETQEIKRRRTLYRQDRLPPDLKNRSAIVVDDGLATGATARAALRALRGKGLQRLIVAVPVAPAETLQRLRAEADEVICLATPSPFNAIGLYYRDFHQLSDQEVNDALARARSA